MKHRQFAAVFRGPRAAFCVAAALFLSTGALLLAAAQPETHSLQAATKDWAAAAAALENDLGPAAVPLTWSRARLRADTLAGFPGDGFEAQSVTWVRVTPERESGGAYVFNFRRAPARLVLLRGVFEMPAGPVRAFFSGDGFVGLIRRGEMIYGAFFDRGDRPEEKSVELDLPPGRACVILAVEAPAGESSLRFRIDRTTPGRGRARVLSALERRFPADCERLAAGWMEAGRILEEEPGGLEAAAHAYLRASELAADPADLHAALEGLARCRRGQGRFDDELDLRRRLASLARERLDGHLASDLVSLAGSAFECGSLDTAWDAVCEALCGPDPAAGVLGEMLPAVRDYAAADRIARLAADLDRSRFDSAALEALDEASRPPHGAFLSLDLNYTAGEALENARRLRDAGAFHEAALELEKALEEPEALVPADGFAAGVSRAASEILSGSAPLQHAWRRLPQALSEPGDARRLILSRPGTKSACSAYISTAREAARQGRYNLAALAAARCLKEFRREAEAAALAVSSLFAAGRMREAAELCERLPAEILDRRISRGLTLGEFIDDFELQFNGPSPRAPGPFDVMNVLWRAPLDPGVSRGAGTLRRSRVYTPDAAAAVADGRIYVINGTRLVARDLETGEKVFARPLPALPGTAISPPPDAGRALAEPPSAPATGGGAVYLTLDGFDHVRSRRISYVAACDGDSGRTLWLRPADSVEGVRSFVSPPAWGHDRLYIVAEMGGRPPAWGLVALDARTGAFEWAAPLCAACASPGSAGLPSTRTAAPEVSGGFCYAAPNAGAVAEIDCLTGRVCRALPYERAVPGRLSSGLVRLAAGRYGGSIEASGGAVFAPADSAETFILPADAGPAVCELPGVSEVIGITDDTAFAVASDVYGIDTATGRVAWRAGLEGAHFLGGGIVKDGVAFVPAIECLFILGADGEILGRPRWPEEMPRGRLAAAGEYIAAFSAQDYALIGFDGRAQSAGEARGEKAAGKAGAAGPAGRMWAAPRIESEFVIRQRCDAPPVVVHDEEKRFLFLPGAAASLWDVTGPARLLWRVPAPFRPTGATFCGGRLIVHDDWRLAGLDAETGGVEWVYETPRRRPVELSGAQPVRQVLCEGRSVAFARGGEVFILDAASGGLLDRHSIFSDAPLEMTAGRGFFAIVAGDRRGGTRCAVIDAKTGAGRTMLVVDRRFAAGAGICAEGERVYICSPNDPFAACIDARAGARLWLREGLPRVARIFEAGVFGDKFVYSGVRGGAEMRAQVLDAATGRIIGLHRGLAFAATGDGNAVALGEDMSLSKFPLKGTKSLFREDSGLGPHWLPPEAWHFGGGAITVLAEEAPRRKRGALGLAAYDSKTGRTRGLWRLPLCADEKWRPRLHDLGDGRLAALGGDGVVVFTLPSDGENVSIPAYGPRGEREGAAVLVARAQRAPGPPVEALLVDGDLAEWRGARWLAGGGGEGAAEIAFGRDESGLAVALCVPGGDGGKGARVLRLAAGRDAAQSGVVDFDLLFSAGERLVTVAQGDAAEVTVMTRPNRTGGTDYEIMVPWRALGGRGGAGGIGAALACVEADGEVWGWPEPGALRYRRFGMVDFGREAGGHEDD